MANKNVFPKVYCAKLGLDVIKPDAIEQIEKPKGAQMNKYIAIQGKTKSFFKLLWKGKINSINCLGCELPECWMEGTGGVFGRHKLFTCSYGRGVLIPINDTIKSCESADESNHFPLAENDDLTANNICCFEPLDKLSNDIEVNSLVFCQQLKAGGKCKWVGLINGKGYVGIEFDEIHRRPTRFNELSRILKIDDQIKIFPLEFVENAKQHFIFDKIVDTGKIFDFEFEEDGKYLGNPVAMDMTRRDGKTKKFIGEVKWTGKINNKKCVGLDMEDETEFGMNGIINQHYQFECMEKHGLVTALSNVKLYNYDNNVPMLPSGIINPDKYLRCNETFGDIFLNTQRIKKDGMVNVKLLNGQANLKGTLKWHGSMNNVPVCAVELLQEHENGTNGRFWRTRLFECRDKLAIATLQQNLSPIKSELKFIKEINLNVVDPFNVREIENGRQINKSTCYKIKGAVKILNIKWRGIVDGELCVGCELSGPVECGTDGKFGNKNLFKFPDRRGVLIPTGELRDSCESTAHSEIAILPGRGWPRKETTYFIDPDCICCIELTESLQKHPDLRIKSRIKIHNIENKQIGGLCEWIGLINGQEALGITMDKDVKGTNGIFSCFRMFTCVKGKGVLVLADNIIHESEKTQFIANKIVDINKPYRISPCGGDNGISIGKPIKMNLNSPNGRNRDFIGEVKWIGRINDEKCVGLDMEDEMEHGMDGKIGQSQRFECMERHGLVALLSDVELHENAENPQILDNGIIAPNKFIRFQEEHSKRYLDDKNIKMNEFVFVKLYNPELKLKGKLRWIGWMNKLLVCVIELDQDHENGSNGIFWRRRIVDSHGKRVIATHINNVYKDVQHEELLPIEIENYESIIKMLLTNEGDVNKLNQNQESIFDIANTLKNESFVNVMLDHCKQPLKLSVTKSFEVILSNLVESENWNLLSQIIGHAHVDEISNKYLMSLSISVLKKQNTTELFDKIMSLCLYKNIILCGGETVVTALIKSGIPSSTMVSILERKIFDTNKPNLENEAPLILACKFLLFDVVNVLVALNCDLKRYRHEAIESAVLAKLEAKNENNHLKVEFGSEIIKLLSETIDNDSIQCQICMDRSKDTVLNCGHTFCLNCVNELYKCPNCFSDISTSSKIFL